MLALSLIVAMWLFDVMTGAMIVGIIAIHEVGHAIAYRLVGERVYSIAFIPLIGGVTIGSPPRTATRDAIVSLGGTTVSWFTLMALLVISVTLDEGPTMTGLRAAMTGDVGLAEACIAAFCLGFIINVSNLIPVPFLDGGRTVAAMAGRVDPTKVSRALGMVGLLIAAGLFWSGLVVFAVICAFLSALSFSSHASIRHYDLPSRGQVAVILGMCLRQFGLYGLAVLGFVMVAGQSDFADASLLDPVAAAPEGVVEAGPALRGPLDDGGMGVALSEGTFRQLELSAVSP